MQGLYVQWDIQHFGGTYTSTPPDPTSPYYQCMALAGTTTHFRHVRYTPGFTYTQTVTIPATAASTITYLIQDFINPKSTQITPDKPEQDLNTDGYQSPVYIGRVDQVDWFLVTLGDGSTLPLDGTLVSGTDGVTLAGIGQMTGVDLGALVDGDTIMIAADASEGYVWFGKNGDWYGPGDASSSSAPVSPVSDGPANGTKWAAIMDGCKKSATPATVSADKPAYFPAVGYRIGHFQATIIYDKSKLKYKPPAGFEVYGQAKTV